MKNLLLITLLLGFVTQSIRAQNYDMPPNPEAGKCYERCFDYDKKFEWKTVDCSKIKEQKTKYTEAQLLEIEQKMQKYQEKLKALGYKVELTGIADNKTIIAHHKYLKAKKKKKK